MHVYESATFNVNSFYGYKMCHSQLIHIGFALYDIGWIGARSYRVVKYSSSEQVLLSEHWCRFL